MYIIFILSFVFTEAQTPSKHPKARAKTEPSLQTDDSMDLQPLQSSRTTWPQSDFHPMLRLPTSEQAVLIYGDTNVTTTGRKKCNLNAAKFQHRLDAAGLSSSQVDTFDVKLFAT